MAIQRARTAQDYAGWVQQARFGVNDGIPFFILPQQINETHRKGSGVGEE